MGREYKVEELEYIYRPRRSYEQTIWQNGTGVLCLIGVIIGLIIMGVLPQTCKPPGYEGPYDRNVSALESEPGLVYNAQCWWYSLTGAIMFAIFIFGYTLLRAFPLQGLYVMMPLVLGAIPMVIIFPLSSVFQYLKLFSVSGGCIFVLFFRLDNMFKRMVFEKSGYWEEGNNSLFSKVAKFTYVILRTQHFDRYRWRWFLWGALVVNILEAVTFDMINQNYANGIVGIYCILAMPRGYFTSASKWLERRVFWWTFLQPNMNHVLFVDDTPTVGHFDMIYETDAFWVFIYTTWDACFAYQERKDHFVIVCLVLIAGLYGSADLFNYRTFFQIDPHLYIQCRSFTLWIRYIIFAYYDVYNEFSDTTLYFDKFVANVWGYVNLGMCGLYMAYMLYIFDGRDSRASIDLVEGAVEHRSKKVDIETGESIKNLNPDDKNVDAMAAANPVYDRESHGAPA